MPVISIDDASQAVALAEGCTFLNLIPAMSAGSVKMLRDIAAGNWATITENTRNAVALAKQAREG